MMKSHVAIETARGLLAAGLCCLMAGVPLAWGQSVSQDANPPKKPPEILSVTSALVAAAKKEGRMYLRHAAPPETTGAIAESFKRRFGIDVVIERRISAEGTSTFATEERAGRHIVDVHASTDRQGMLSLIKEGLYQSYKVKNDAQFPRTVKIENFAYVPYWSSAVLAYNTDRLKPSEAEKLFNGTWKGLLDPRFKNKRIGVISPLATAINSVWFWALSESPKYGESFLRAVAAMDPVIYPTQPVAEDALHAGEVDLLVGEVADPALMALMKGAHIAWTYPDILPSNAAVYHLLSAHAPHPNAARLFLAWLLSEDGAKALSMEVGREVTMNIKVPKSPQVQKVLAATGWWKPYPDKARFTPAIEEFVVKELEYRKQMATIFGISSR